MKKLSISKVIEFSRKSEKSRLNFLKNHNRPKEKSIGGGDYWVSSTSAISNAFRHDDNSIISDKIEHLLERKKATPHKIAKIMFQRNIDILYKFVNFNFSKWIANKELTFLSKPSSYSLLQIDNLPIQVRPNHVFSFEVNGRTKIGAVTFVSKIEGYTQNELATFSDSVYRYLKVNYSKEFSIESKLCLAIDMQTLAEVSYDKIITGEIGSILDRMIALIKAAA